jgi:hypothetical protein
VVRKNYTCKYCSYVYEDGGFGGCMIRYCPNCKEDLWINKQCNNCIHQLKSKLRLNGYCGHYLVMYHKYKCDDINSEQNCKEFSL